MLGRLVNEAVSTLNSLMLSFNIAVSTALRGKPLLYLFTISSIRLSSTSSRVVFLVETIPVVMWVLFFCVARCVFSVANLSPPAGCPYGSWFGGMGSWFIKARLFTNVFSVLGINSPGGTGFAVRSFLLPASCSLLTLSCFPIASLSAACI